MFRDMVVHRRLAPGHAAGDVGYRPKARVHGSCVWHAAWMAGRDPHRIMSAPRMAVSGGGATCAPPVGRPVRLDGACRDEISCGQRRSYIRQIWPAKSKHVPRLGRRSTIQRSAAPTGGGGGGRRGGTAGAPRRGHADGMRSRAGNGEVIYDKSGPRNRNMSHDSADVAPSSVAPPLLGGGWQGGGTARPAVLYAASIAAVAVLAAAAALAAPDGSGAAYAQHADGITCPSAAAGSE